MAKRSYLEIQAEIERLKVEAEAAKAEEAKGVVEKIKTAIAFYDIKPADLFDCPRSKPRPTRKRARRAKYRDEHGHTWRGIGKRPNWLKEQLAKGKSLDDLRV